MKPIVILLAAIACLLFAIKLNADPPKAAAPESSSTKLTPLMWAKLERSKGMLEGLTLEDFDKVASNARSLHLLSTESGWNVMQTAEYAAQSRDFQRATDLIVAAAEDKDIHRAALGYVALTVRCVECHSYMRKVQAAQASGLKE